MTKKIFIENAVVVGAAVAVMGSATVFHTGEQVLTVDVLDDSPVDVGYLYDEVSNTFAAPPAPQPVDPPTKWLIDVGPFMDRFGAAKMDVLVSANATIKAILTDMLARKWIDLQRADVPLAITVISSIIPSVTQELKTVILTTPVAPEENLALRKLYFS